MRNFGRYLQEAVMAVDFGDPMIKEHSPKVMPQLVANLQTQVIRKLRLFLLAVQPLAQTG